MPASHINTVPGAGPSGLVAAKSLLYEAPKDFFRVTVFDSQHDIGGIWPTSKTDDKRLIHPLMVVNQSKHTVQFGDLAWDKDTPQLPQAWVVGKYCRKYHQKWLQDKENYELRLNTRVLKTEKAAGSGTGWAVTTRSNSTEETKEFDYMIFAGGIHSKPVLPDSLPEDPKVPIIHSSQYRDLKGLLGTEQRVGKKILMLGGQQSVVEVASTVSLQLNAAQNSPKESDIPDIDKYTVHQVVHTPIWNFPLFTSPEVSLPCFGRIEMPSNVQN